MTAPTPSLRTPRHWTDDETEQIRDLLYRGRTWHGIATSLGRSVSAVKNRVQVARIDVHATRGDYGGWHTVQSIRRMLGLNWATMQRLVRDGDIKTTRRTQYRHRRYINDDDLRQFLSDWRFFMEWHPLLIRDPDWRIYGQQCREAVWGRWLSINELAHIIGIHRASMFRWFRDGVVPCAIQRGHRWYVWSRHLDGWPPLQGQRL